MRIMKRVFFYTTIVPLLALVMVSCSERVAKPLFEEYRLELDEERYEVSIRYQHITNTDKSEAFAAIELANYLKTFESTAVEPMDIDASARAVAEEYAEEAEEYGVDGEEAQELRCSYHLDQVAFTVRDERILCYETNIEVYAGGPHGGSSMWYECYDLSTGQAFDFAYLYEGEWADGFKALVYDRLGGLVENLFVESPAELPISESVLITESGLVIVYQPYAVACYADGILSVEVSDDELAQIGVPLLWLEDSVSEM